MAYDIYGNNLRQGHCEVHPHVHEEYPCSLCYAEHQKNEQDREQRDQAEKEQETEYYLGQARAEIDRLNALHERLKSFVEELAGEDCEYGEASPGACMRSRKHYQCLPCKAQQALLDLGAPND